jgi:nucleotide-binding universal stress UspA family protein
MSWKSIVAGVDASEAGVAAATLACDLASRAHAECRLVHATADVSKIPASLPPKMDVDLLTRRLTAAATQEIESLLADEVPGYALDELEVRLGKPGSVIPDVVRERRADLVVLGGKHHLGPTRWFGGSTAHHLIRTMNTPMLVAHRAKPVIERVLVPADISPAADIIIPLGRWVADLLGARLSILHVVEAIPYTAEFPSLVDHTQFTQWSEERFKGIVERHISPENAQIISREGATDEVIVREVENLNADLVILGSHGKGWVDRLLVGSTTFRLLNRLPTSLLVVPVGAPESFERVEIADPVTGKVKG